MDKPHLLACLLAASLLGVAGNASSGDGHSVARVWNEELLGAIRNDFARPTVHARNLWHASVAMWDAWAAYNPSASGYLVLEKYAVEDANSAREETMSYAVFGLLNHRFANSPAAAASLDSFHATMVDLGFDPSITTIQGDSPAALGNRIAAAIIAAGAVDGANEANDYANTFYVPVNPPLAPVLAGNPDIVNPDRWQPLALDVYIDQSGHPILDGVPDFLSPEWGYVQPFSLADSDKVEYTRDGNVFPVYLDPGPPPRYSGSTANAYREGFEMVLTWSSHLDPGDGVLWDISPGAQGNAPLPSAGNESVFYDFENGGDWGPGHELNPTTGQPYSPNIVPRGDYTRVLAEFWADGPDSETPPGHWFVIANYVSDHPDIQHRLEGVGPVMDRLEWDVKLYFALAGAMHDSAIAAWSVKGWHDFLRPISAIRHLAGLGQRSNPGGPAFDMQGITLRPGFIEVVNSDTTAPGERHEHLAGNEGKIAVYAWRGPDAVSDPDVDTAGVGWILAENWWPYQRPSFVTPPFAGYVSGHSTFSRAAAEVLTRFTGSPFFPGGMGEFLCPKDEFLVFEKGPSVDVVLQWATYYDASDQTSLSRIWGGIHPPADDLPGRMMGQIAGASAYSLASASFGETEGSVSRLFSSGFE